MGEWREITTHIHEQLISLFLRQVGEIFFDFITFFLERFIHNSTDFTEKMIISH